MLYLDFVEEDIVRGSHRYVSGRKIDFTKICDEQSKENSREIYYLHLCCDELQWSGSSAISGSPKLLATTLRYVHIFARVLWSDLPPEQTACVNQSSPRVFMVYERSHCAMKLSNDHTLSQDADPDCIGFFIDQKAPVATDQDDMLPQSIYTVPASMLHRTMVSRFSSGLEAQSFPKPPGHLLSLLRTMLVQAYFDLVEDVEGEELAKSKLRFVIQVTYSAPEHFELTSNARALLSALQVPQLETSLSDQTNGKLRLQIPDLVIETCQRGLEAAAERVDKVESSITLLDDKKETTSAISEAAKISIEAVVKSMNNDYIPPEATLEEIISDIREAKKWEDTLRNPADILLLENCQRDIEDASAAYMKAQEAKARRDMIINIISIVVGVAIAFATMNGGALVSKATLIKTLQNPAGAKVTAMEKAVRVMKGIVEQKPFFQSLGKAFKDYEKSKKLDGKKESHVGLIDNQNIPTTSSEINYIGLEADWDLWGANNANLIENMRIELGNTKPADKELEQHYDKVMVAIARLEAEFVKARVRGKAFLSQQRELHKRLQSYYRGLSEKEARQARLREVKALQSGIGSTAKVSAKSDEMAAQLKEVEWAAQIRFLDYYYRALRSYVYQSGTGEYPENLLPSRLLTATSLTSACHDLAEAILQLEAGSTDLQSIENVNLVVSTRDEGIFSTSWKISLKECQRVEFLILPQLPDTVPHVRLWRNYERLRVLNVWAEFRIDGATPKSLADMIYTVSLGPHFFESTPDADDGPCPEYWMKPALLIKTGQKSKWLSTRAVRWTPFCSGHLEFQDPPPELFDVTEITVNMELEGVSRGKGGSS